MATRKSQKQKNATPKVLAMTLVGGGLILLAAMAFLLLRPSNTPTANAEAEDPRNSSIPVQVDFPAPELSLYDLNSNAVSLTDYRGQLILVNNWATWCPPCRAEMPTLNAYYEDHKDEGFSVVAIESGESKTEVQEFVDAFDLTFPVWLDTGQRSIQAFRNMGLPSSYVINGDGQVVLAWTGAVSRETLEKYVTPLLQK